MAARITGTILTYARKTVNNYNVADYTSIDLNIVKKYIDSLDISFFDYYQVSNNDKWEHISNRIYGNLNYWDVLLVINNRNPLTGLPFDFDTISLLAADRILEYERRKTIDQSNPMKVPTNVRTDGKNNEYDMMFNDLESLLVTENDNIRVIRIIKPGMMHRFIQDAHVKGIF